MKKFGAAVAMVLLLATSACGGGRPSTGDLKKAIDKHGDDSALGHLPSGASECMAKVLHDSDISDKALQAIVDNKKDFKPSSADNKALEKAAPDFVKCVKK